MSDRRLTADPAYVTGAEAARIARPVADLLASPDGPRDRQLLYGDPVTVLGRAGDWAYVRSDKDGYHGFADRQALDAPMAASHWVSAPATHAYAAADLKSPEQTWLSLGSQVTVIATQGAFAETELGFVPHQHLCPVNETETDPVSVAQRLLGTPYLWGGNSRAGIDCSGLVQVACQACGLGCPGDSDLQAAALGQEVGADAAPRRGDLWFWKGHVAWIADDSRILHANAHAMAVTFEDRDAAVARIAAAGDGPVTGRRRF